MAVPSPDPAISVLIVSDYAAGEAKSWDGLAAALRQWAAQEGPPPAEFLLVESDRFQGQVPQTLFEILPQLRVLHFSADSSYELKNRAVQAASGEYVALVDADCVPGPGWLQSLRAAIVRQPAAAAISARTLYPGRSAVERVLGLLARAYLDPGGAGNSPYISGNAAAYRRELYLRHPLPLSLGAFAGRIQSESMLRAGETLYFEPGMVVVHEFEGWPMEFDIRRNHGYCTVATRLADPRLPHSGLISLGPAAIPLIAAGKMWDSFGVTLRCYSHYNVAFYELPLAFVLIGFLHLMEIPGMLAAYQGRRSPGETAYR